MNPTTFSPSRRPDFTARAGVRPETTSCHTFVRHEYLVPMAVWGGSAFRPDEPFLLDTGCDFCTVDYDFAIAHNFQLDIRCAIDVGGLTGSALAWVTRRYVRFAQLSTMRFSFHFLVQIPLNHPDHPQHDPAAPPPAFHPPLLGTADLLEAFELVLTASGVGFYLRSGQGTPIP